MDIIHTGQGLRWQHWLNVVKRSPRAQTSAIVTQQGDPAGSSEIFESETAIPVYASLEAALAEVPAQVAVATGGEAVQFATQALKAGLWVILDELGAVDAGAAGRLIALSKSTGCALLVPRRYVYASCEKALRRLLQHLGPIGHVSCMDSQPMPSDAGVNYSPQAQLTLAGVGHFGSLARLFDSAPVSVMTRLAGSDAGNPCTEAFLTLDSNLHVQYFGSAGAGINEHILWIEGARGSAKTDGSNVWWRKRGWPVFVPVRIWPRLAGYSPEADDSALLAQAAADLQRSSDWQDDGHFHLLASVAAAVESARAGACVQVAQLTGSC